MSPGIWERVKRFVSTARPERQEDSPAPVAESGGSPSATLGESQSLATVDRPLEGARTVLTVRRPSHHRAPQSLGDGQIVAGRFRVVRFLSSGGMGEVYEAWDSELGERVALKTIRSQIASFPSIIERFKQEVRQARGISHVNVCRVYEVFSHAQPSGERIWFLTMELLEGQTLAERLLQRGPIEPQAAFDLVEQIVAGLAAAHELGIVHRDFKSSNTMLVDSGAGRTRAVITDFGLALKVLAGHHIAPEESKQGTAQYMAPEQARGEDVGFAADQYALGVVMCEMLTGERPTRDLADGSNKVQLPIGHHFNPRWEAVIRRCLEFRPEDRYPDIRDVASGLSAQKRSKGMRIVGTAAALMLAIGGGALLAWLRPGNVHLEEVAQLTPSTDYSGQPSISRDGTVVAYSSDRAEAGNTDIWLQHLPNGSPVRLTTDPAQDVDPGIAPDGSSVVFRSQRAGGGIYIVDVTGGGERLLVPGGRDPRFSPDGRSIVYWVGDPDRNIPTGETFVLSLANGSSVRVARDFQDARFPVWSSDGQYILFTGCRTGGQQMSVCSEWWVTNLDGTRVQNTGALALLRRQHLQPVETLGGWRNGSALFSARRGSATSLWQLKISESTLVATGMAQPLTSGSARIIDELSAAENDNVAFSQLSAAVHVWMVADSVDPKALPAKITQDAANDFSPFISHNGRWLVFCRGAGTRHDIWIRDIVSGRESLFLESGQDKTSPILDESGQTVAFEARDERGNTSVLVAGQGRPTRLLCTGCSRPTGWFDGDHAVLHGNGLPSVIKLSYIGSGDTRTVLEAKDISLGEASWSPENQYLLFTASSPGGAKRVYAVRFTKSTGAANSAWVPITEETITADRGRWSGDGKTVFYLSTRDGSPCLWGQHFDPQAGKVQGPAFPVMHLHNPRLSAEMIAPDQFQISASGNSVYLNLGEASATIWIGRFKRPGFFSFLSQPH